MTLLTYMVSSIVELPVLYKLIASVGNNSNDIYGTFGEEVFNKKRNKKVKRYK